MSSREACSCEGQFKTLRQCELTAVHTQGDLEEPGAEKGTREQAEEGAEDSHDEEMDEIDLMMLQERLGLEVENQLENLEAQGLSSKDLKRLLSLEGQRCCNDTGLWVRASCQC
jgi:hypothetical protein